MSEKKERVVILDNHPLLRERLSELINHELDMEVCGEECRKLIAPTLAEEGCINYDLYRSTEDRGTFMFYENWASRPHWERHMESPHETKGI